MPKAKNALLVSMLLLAAAPALADDIATPILKVHNRERAAVRVEPLVWDDTLADHASVWAAKRVQLGKLQHSEIRDRPGEGENLWMGSANSYSPGEMAEAWADEKRDFRYGVFPRVTAGAPWQTVGHYAQMIWRGTTRIGCALAHGRKWDVLVCRYSPPGNFVGETPY